MKPAVYLLILVVLSISNFANASHTCLGKVKTIDISNSNNLQLSIEGIGDGNAVCNFETNWGSITPNTCQAMFSMALAAQMAEKPLKVYFNDDSNTNCAKGNWKDLSQFGFYYLRVQ